MAAVKIGGSTVELVRPGSCFGSEEFITQVCVLCRLHLCPVSCAVCPVCAPPGCAYTWSLCTSRLCVHVELLRVCAPPGRVTKWSLCVSHQRVQAARAEGAQRVQLFRQGCACLTQRTQLFRGACPVRDLGAGARSGGVAQSVS